MKQPADDVGHGYELDDGTSVDPKITSFTKSWPVCPKPLPNNEIASPPAVAPYLGRSSLTPGSEASYEKTFCDVAELVPPGVVTVTLTWPAASAGMYPMVIEVGLFTV
jgi:hypothetical protein